jgi:pimeloyl-ACP methyl ester carboxylesterase
VQERVKQLLRGMAVGLSLTALSPYLVPVSPLRGTRPPRDLADGDSLFARLNGLDVHYKARGEGQPLVILLHGFGASAFSWRQVLAPLGELGLAVAYDRPAFGLTERPLRQGSWPPGESPYGLGAQVRLVLAMIAHLGAERAVLVGHSAGGALALETAYRFPQAVRGLVLVSPAVYTRTHAPRGLRPLLRTPQARRLGPLAVRAFVSRAARFLARAYHDPSRITAEDLDGYRVITRADDWDRALWEFVLASEEPTWSPERGAPDVPLLIMAGDDDRVVPTAESIRLAHALPGAGLALIAQCGHMPQEEQPKAFLKHVTAFLEGLA